jgi:hypothetical protein
MGCGGLESRHVHQPSSAIKFALTIARKNPKALLVASVHSQFVPLKLNWTRKLRQLSVRWMRRGVSRQSLRASFMRF